MPFVPGQSRLRLCGSKLVTTTQACQSDTLTERRYPVARVTAPEFPDKSDAALIYVLPSHR